MAYRVRLFKDILGLASKVLDNVLVTCYSLPQYTHHNRRARWQ